MIKEETYLLTNGVRIPKLGLGTWMIPDEVVASSVKEAIKLGYKMIDTAQAYENERGVGEGIRTCGVDRKELFVGSKVRAEFKDYDSAKKSIDDTLQLMGLDYLDQIIIHSPEPWNEFRGNNSYYKENIEVWRALEDAYNEGKVRVIGVSNLLIEDLKNIISHCRIKPMVNQILLHISNTNRDLIDFCKSNNIQVEAYSPIAHGEALKNKKIVNMANKYKVSPTQLCIRYAIQVGAVALPKTSNPIHMESNKNVDFVIANDDMDKLMNMEKIENYGEFSFLPVFSGK